MTHGALGTLFPFILLNCIKQGRQDAEIFRYEKMEALAGQDVTLACAVESNSTIYITMIEWTKNRSENQKLALYSPRFGEKVSPNVNFTVNDKTMTSYLHLHGLTKSDSDIYICSLSTFPLGSIRRETELKVRDVATGTEKGFPESPNSIPTTTLTTRHSPVVTQTTDASTDATNGPNTSRGIVTVGGNATSYTNEAQSRVTPAPATSPDVFSSSNYRGTSPTFNVFSDQTPASDASTGHGGSTSASTMEARNDASTRTRQPEEKPTMSLAESSTLGNITDPPGNTAASTALYTGDGASSTNEDGTQNHLLLVSTIVPVLVFLAVAGFLCRKWIIKKRMDLPPAFKPPPPPVKYTAVRSRDFSGQPFSALPTRAGTDQVVSNAVCHFKAVSSSSSAAGISELCIEN